jgi:hypothetical protein
MICITSNLAPGPVAKARPLRLRRRRPALDGQGGGDGGAQGFDY